MNARSARAQTLSLRPAPGRSLRTPPPGRAGSPSEPDIDRAARRQRAAVTAVAAAGVTPSALLRRLHKLEERVDVQLFEPEPTAGLHLTDSGRRMEPLARDALQRLQDLERFVDAEHTLTTLESR